MRSVAASMARWLRSAAPARARGQVTVALVSDVRMRQLNRRFRGQDHVTDVLSFPAGPPTRYGRASVPSNPPLGDIVIAAGRARRQAREAGHALGIELRVLALHGLLHLLGYDHERDSGEMARLERRLRRTNGLDAGLIERQ
jgi:probable rRNA maturation factor